MTGQYFSDHPGPCQLAEYNPWVEARCAPQHQSTVIPNPLAPPTRSTLTSRIMGSAAPPGRGLSSSPPCAPPPPAPMYPSALGSEKLADGPWPLAVGRCTPLYTQPKTGCPSTAASPPNTGTAPPSTLHPLCPLPSMCPSTAPPRTSPGTSAAMCPDGPAPPSPMPGSLCPRKDRRSRRNPHAVATADMDGPGALARPSWPCTSCCCCGSSSCCELSRPWPCPCCCPCCCVRSGTWCSFFSATRRPVRRHTPLYTTAYVPYPSLPAGSLSRSYSMSMCGMLPYRMPGPGPSPRTWAVAAPGWLLTCRCCGVGPWSCSGSIQAAREGLAGRPLGPAAHRGCWPGRPGLWATPAKDVAGGGRQGSKDGCNWV